MERLPFVDIHTHHKDKGDHLRVVSFFLSDAANVAGAGPYSIGIHPYHVAEENGSLVEILSQLPYPPIAIGETGIDHTIATPISLQMEVFLQHLKIAKHYQLPVIVHCVRGYSDILGAIKSYPKLTYILHAFEAKGNTVDSFIKYNVYFSFGARELNRPQGAENIRKIPLDRLFLETDLGGDSIEDVYKQASSLLSIPIPKLKDIIYLNYKRIFE